ncbi:MAG: SAM-dependent methyltransferase [Firmicutes bacterium]|nr:SAM-dependent methyltransferase [Bacillota bacterium]
MDEKLVKLLADSIEEEQLIQAIFSGLRKKSTPYKKVTVKPILLRDTYLYQAEYHFEKKVTHENLNKEECLALCTSLIETTFKQANLFCVDGDYQVLANKPDKARILKKPASKTMGNLSHNRDKKYLIPEGEPCDFLIRLGVMTPQGQVHAKHYGKFRHIYRFLEIVDDVMDHLPGTNAPLKIIDFGCGKAYLTFALYYYLKKQKNFHVDIVGLDLKEDVIAFCNNVAQDLNYDGLHFEMGDIADYDETARADMVVTLHACDVATDFALMKAVTWEASVILSVPCCQHELFYQIENDMNASILKQGILKERISAILTDGLRALKLEEHGYDVSMIEFTSLEHTAKNIMLRCVRDNVKKPSAARKKAMEHAAAEYKKLTEFWNVTPTIGQMK